MFFMVSERQGQQQKDVSGYRQFNEVLLLKEGRNYSITWDIQANRFQDYLTYYYKSQPFILEHVTH